MPFHAPGFPQASSLAEKKPTRRKNQESTKRYWTRPAFATLGFPRALPPGLLISRKHETRFPFPLFLV